MQSRSQRPPRAQVGIPPAVALPLRAFLGVTFLYAGLQKLLDPNFFSSTAPGSIGEQLHGYVRTGSPISWAVTHIALPHASFIGAFVAGAEIWIGFATLVGLLSKIAAVGGLALSLTFFLTASWTVRPYFLGPDLPYLFAWLTLLLIGPGPFNADAYLFSYARKQAVSGNRRDRRARQRAAATWPRTQSAARSTTMTRSTFLRGIGASITLTAISAAIAELAHHRAPQGSRGGANAAASLSGGASRSANASFDSLGGGDNLPTATATVVDGSKANSAPAGVPGAAPTSQPLGGVASGGQNSAAGAQPNRSNPKPTPTASEQPPAGAILLGNISAVPKNQAGIYTDPASGDPALLVHLPDDRFFAFDAVCPHAGCTVEYDSSQQLLVCPCHGATFDPAQRARVLNGPARQPLASLKVKILGNGDVYAS